MNSSGRFTFQSAFAKQNAASALLLLLVVPLTGCGQSTYAERVERTKQLYRYQQQLDQALQAEWTRPDWGLAMRPPQRFRLMPAPAPPKPNAEGVVEVEADTRQPAYLGVELPGLVAAWQIPQEAFLYLCSNHQRFIDAQGTEAATTDPESLLVDLEAVLQQGLEFTLSPDPARSSTELHARFDERIPTTDAYALPKPFKSVRIEKTTDPKFHAYLYEHSAGKIQVAILLVYSPDFTKGATAIRDGVRLALETLRVEPNVPRRAAPAGQPGNTGPARSAF
jgi:hypothetical protein